MKKINKQKNIRNKKKKKQEKYELNGVSLLTMWYSMAKIQITTRMAIKT